MLAVAWRRAVDEGLANVEFRHGDARTDELADVPVDAVVSRFGVMFFDDAHAPFANLARAVKPPGRRHTSCSSKPDG